IFFSPFIRLQSLRRGRGWRCDTRPKLIAVSRGSETQGLTGGLLVPADGIQGRDVILRFPELEDVDGLLPAFGDPEMREAGTLPAFGREELTGSLHELPPLAATGRLLPLSALDPGTREVIGAGMLHHLDSERQIVEIGYFVLPQARGRGIATAIA